MRATVWARCAAVFVGVLLSGCGDEPVGSPGGSPPIDEPPAGALTYFEHVKPIFDAKCTSCHAPGEIGPFDMTSYDELADYAGLIKAVVESKVMPPWLAADGCSEYVADRSLDDAQIAAISKWVDDGAYRGNPALEAGPLEAKPDLALSRVDLTLEMPVEYSALQTPDDYRCFVIDWPETSLKYVTGFRANPGNPAVVHHVIAFLATPDLADAAIEMDEAEEGPGYTCFGTANLGAGTAWIGSWAPGSRGSDFPPNTGLPVEPGSKIVLQVHYNTFAAGPQPDRTSVDVRLADTVEKEAWIQPWTNPQWIFGDDMQIPAGQMDVEHSFSYDLTSYLDIPSFTMHSAGLHMHTLGTRGSLRVKRANGDDDCLLDIPRWDFHWQGAYGFAEPKVLEAGDRLSIECHWDNPTAQDVSWGEGTGDEMCLGAFYLTQ